MIWKMFWNSLRHKFRIFYPTAMTQKKDVPYSALASSPCSEVAEEEDEDVIDVEDEHSLMLRSTLSLY